MPARLNNLRFNYILHKSENVVNNKDVENIGIIHLEERIKEDELLNALNTIKAYIFYQHNNIQFILSYLQQIPTYIRFHNRFYKLNGIFQIVLFNHFRCGVNISCGD